MFRMLFAVLFLALYSCNNSNPTESQSAPQNCTVETYIYQDVSYEVKFLDSMLVEDANSRHVQALLENPNCGICPDPKNPTVTYLYLNEEELKKVTEKIQGKVLAKRTGTHEALLVGCISLGCPNWNEEHWSWTAETDGCLASPWNNALSELFWLGGDNGLDCAVCWEKCGEDKGRSIVVWCASATEVNLRSHCMRRCLWWCCTTWDDQISFIEIWDF